MSAPNEGPLRDELRRRADASHPGRIDLDEVLERSRSARRRRRSTVTGGVASAAAILVAVGVVGSLAGVGGAGSTTADAPVSSELREVAPASPDEDQQTGVAPRDEPPSGDLALGPLAARNRCGAPVVAATDASTSPLSVSVRTDGPLPAGDTSEAEVVLTNVGAATVEGALRAPPSVAVADEDGTVVGLRADAAAWPASVPVRLAPGESIELSAAVEAVSCAAGRVPTPLAAGAYQLTATVVVFPDDTAQAVLVAAAPPVPLRIE